MNLVRIFKFRTLAKAMIGFIFLNILFVISLVAVQFLNNDKIFQRVLDGLEKGTLSEEMETIHYLRRESFTYCTAATRNIEMVPMNILNRALSGMGYQNNCATIMAQIKDQDQSMTPYSRYWHGYQVYLRPMLRFLSLREINIFMFFILILCILLFSLQLAEMTKIWIPIVLFSLAFIFTGLYTLHPVHAFGIILSLLASSYMIRVLRVNSRNYKKILAIFFYGGAILNFFDFLLTPQIMVMFLSYTIILSYYFKKKPNMRLRDLMLLISTGVILWFAGYGMTFLSKMILNIIPFSVEKAILDTFRNMKHRMVDDNAFALDIESTKTFLFSTRLNLANSLWRYDLAKLFTCLILASAIIQLIKVCLTSSNKISVLRDCALLACPAAVGVLWYEILANHSQEHATAHSYQAAYFIFIIPVIAVFIVQSSHAKMVTAHPCTKCEK